MGPGLGERVHAPGASKPTSAGPAGPDGGVARAGAVEAGPGEDDAGPRVLEGSGSLVLLVQVGQSSRKLSSVDYRLTPVKLRSTERYSLKRHRAPRLRRGLAYSPRTAKARAC